MGKECVGLAILAGAELDKIGAGFVGALYLAGLTVVPPSVAPEHSTGLAVALDYLCGLDPVIATELSYTAVFEADGHE